MLFILSASSLTKPVVHAFLIPQQSRGYHTQRLITMSVAGHRMRLQCAVLLQVEAAEPLFGAPGQ